MYNDERRIDTGDVLLVGMGVCVVVLVALAIGRVVVYWIDCHDFYENLDSTPVLVEATVQNDTGSAIILEDIAGNHIVVGTTNADSSNSIGYDEKVKAYVNSTGVKPGDEVVVEARKDFYSNVRVLEDDDAEATAPGNDDNDLKGTSADAKS